MKPFRLSLTLTILASLAFLLILSWLLLSIISFKTAEKNAYSMKGEEGRALLAVILRVVPLPLDVREVQLTAFNSFASALTDLTDFAGLTIIDEKSNIIYSLSDKRGRDKRLTDTIRTGAESVALDKAGSEVFRYAPLLLHGKTVGAARLALSLNREHERLARTERLFMAYFVIDFMLLLGLGFFFLRRSVVFPIRRLLTATERVSEGDYSSTVRVPGSIEIGELADSFNAMLTILREKRELIEKHVSSLEETNRQLKEAREETIRSERLASLGLLAAGTAHEIGTPLAAIMGYAGILKDDLASDPDKADYAKRIEQETNRIDRIVRDLLDYARPVQGERQPTAIGELLEETIVLLTGQGALKTVKVELAIEEGLPEILVDPHQLRQVLINLILNARDSMPDGGPIELHAAQEALTPDKLAGPMTRLGHTKRKNGEKVRELQTPKKGGWVSPCIRIDVYDSGCGIPPENLEAVFDPFFTTKEPGKGTGLGLSIAARIIDSFGGWITVTSDPGMGSCFSIRLPLQNEIKQAK